MFPTIHTILHWRRDCNRKTHYFYILAVLHIKDVFLWILFTMDTKNSPTGFSVDGGFSYILYHGLYAPVMLACARLRSMTQPPFA